MKVRYTKIVGIYDISEPIFAPKVKGERQIRRDYLVSGLFDIRIKKRKGFGLERFDSVLSSVSGRQPDGSLLCN